ncbi:hypothetical protein F5Y16DRAFT_131225 [Xylariaceae sp. FL0255]|nr:hypothetical protein F5Y16DRAFT_131225 [Xylariaceae sp. FL0255]
MSDSESSQEDIFDPEPDFGSDDGASNSAPVYDVPDRKIIAIEHPCTVHNLDHGLKLFGVRPGFSKLLEHTPDAHALPLWLRPGNPTVKPIMSHHAASNNVLLKVTVPKRTGRKRKRGTNGPFIGEIETSREIVRLSDATNVTSFARRDHPGTLLRKLKDNQEQYEVEAVGMIRDSHRYRGLADFQYSNNNAPFLNNVADHFLPLNFSKLKQFELDEGVKHGPGHEIIPPPHFTDKVIGFNYNYDQNPGIIDAGLDEDGETRLQNRQGRKIKYGHFIHCDTFPAPDQPIRVNLDADIRDDRPNVPDSLLSQLRYHMEQRPVWTRRSLLNQVKGTYAETNLKLALQLVGYQFRGGPFRDVIVRYGVDPRTDPQYRDYQTVAFKMSKNMFGGTQKSWQAFRKAQTGSLTRSDNLQSHMWDGKDVDPNNKLWQICDVTDPFITNLIENAKPMPEFDAIGSGWFYPGFWLKIKTVMKAKMVAIARDRLGDDDDDPPKKGYMYNSYLTDMLNQYSDETTRPKALTLEALIRPLRDVTLHHRNNRRPEAPKKQKVIDWGPRILARLGHQGKAREEETPSRENDNEQIDDESHRRAANNHEDKEPDEEDYDEGDEEDYDEDDEEMADGWDNLSDERLAEEDEDPDEDEDFDDD